MPVFQPLFLRRRRRSEARRQSGFTLLELILVLAIMVTVLLMLWGLIYTYTTYFMAGGRHAENSQLIRSLSQLLEEDLSAAIQDPVRASVVQVDGDDAVRRFGLRGTDRTLRIDVVQINPFRPQTASTMRPAAAGLVPHNPQAPELKTIFYDFLPSGGLLRREIDFETPVEMIRDASAHVSEEEDSPWGAWDMNQSFGNDGFGSAFVDEFGDPFAGPASSLALGAPQPTDDALTMHAPEVVDCLFRYSDGRYWTDSWDSIERDGLPVAIEATLQILPMAEARRLRAGAWPSETALQTAERLGLPRPIQQRIVTYLPTSPLGRHTEFQRQRPAPPPQTEMRAAAAIREPVPPEPPQGHMLQIQEPPAPPSPAAPAPSPAGNLEWIRN